MMVQINEMFTHMLPYCKLHSPTADESPSYYNIAHEQITGDGQVNSIIKYHDKKHTDGLQCQFLSKIVEHICTVCL